MNKNLENKIGKYVTINGMINSQFHESHDKVQEAYYSIYSLYTHRVCYGVNTLFLLTVRVAT